MNNHVLLGFLVAPLAPAIVYAAKVGSLFAIPLAALGFAYPAAILFGVPVFLLCRWLGWFRSWQVVSMCFALGSIALLAYHAAFGAPISPTVPFVKTVAAFGGYGACAGFVFWLVALRRPPFSESER